MASNPVEIIQLKPIGLVLVKNARGKACNYAAGFIKPNYPVPSIYCHSLISKDCDERSNEMNYLDLILSL